MNTQEVNQNIKRNVVSNYIALFQRMVTGLVSFRLLYEGLTKEEFGFWALLWSVFGYGVLLDFGFGITVQKKVAKHCVDKDWEELNKSLSTIFYSYCVIAVLLIVAGWASAEICLKFIDVSPENMEQFKSIFIIFLGAMGLIFPLGVFPEILTGQQRISLKNYINVFCSITSFIFICVAIFRDWGLKSIFVIALLGALVPALICGFYAFILIPSLKLRPRLFTWSMLKETSSFSLIAYFIMLSYMIMTKTDLIVISTFLSVQAAAVYMPGLRIGEVYGLLTKQLANVIQPAAAHLHATGDSKALSSLLTTTMRYSILFATPLYLICAFYAETLIAILTGEKDPSTELAWVAHILLLWSYSVIVTHNVYKRIAIMIGHEHRLLKIGLFEAGLNILISVSSVVYFRNVICVALGSLIPTVLVGWCVLWRWASQTARTTYWRLIKQTLLRNWFASSPLFVSLLAGHFLSWQSLSNGILHFILGAFLSGIAALAGIWFIALQQRERDIIRSKLRV